MALNPSQLLSAFQQQQQQVPSQQQQGAVNPGGVQAAASANNNNNNNTTALPPPPPPPGAVTSLLTSNLTSSSNSAPSSATPLSASAFLPSHMLKLQQNLANLQTFGPNSLMSQGGSAVGGGGATAAGAAGAGLLGGGIAGVGAGGGGGLGGGGGINPLGLGGGGGGGGNLMANQVAIDEEKVYALVLELQDPQRREQALLELSKRREHYEELALVLWHSFGTMAILIQEIISCYPLLTPPTLTSAASNRVCNALALLQCVASHPETRASFLHAHIPLFLYPFLNTTSKTRPFEYLRLTSLGVIGALVKNDSTEVITFLLSTEIIPLCLRIMETGSELSKIVAIFIVQKILLDDVGLSYICQTYERFYAVGTVLSNMVLQLVETQSVRLLKHVVRCYLRLSDNPRAREALRQCLPGPLRDATFSAVLKDDITTKRCLGQLLVNLSDPLATA
ncbi:RNA-binding protein, CCR4-NOT complex subunit Rcd1 [Sorochytrium milnesiophthora]